MSARDTIGWHFDAAARCWRRAEFQLQMSYTERGAGKIARADRLLESYYEHEGAAAGYAFRAAELAYELGYAHGRGAP